MVSARESTKSLNLKDTYFGISMDGYARGSGERSLSPGCSEEELEMVFSYMLVVPPSNYRE